MEYYRSEEKIEAAHVDLWARYYAKAKPRKIKGLGMVLQFKCERNAEAEIVKELSEEEKKELLDFAEKEKGNGNNFILPMLKKGARLNAKEVLVNVKARKLKSPKVAEGHTGTHGIQILNLRNRTRAEITEPFSHIINAIENRNTLIEKRKK